MTLTSFNNIILSLEHKYNPNHTISTKQLTWELTESSIYKIQIYKSENFEITYRKSEDNLELINQTQIYTPELESQLEYLESLIYFANRTLFYS